MGTGGSPKHVNKQSVKQVQQIDIMWNQLFCILRVYGIFAVNYSVFCTVCTAVVYCCTINNAYFALLNSRLVRSVVLLFPPKHDAGRELEVIDKTPVYRKA